MATTDQPDDRDFNRVVAFLRSLHGRREVFAKVTLSIQRGKIGMVHVDRSYTADQLPTVSVPD